MFRVTRYPMISETESGRVGYGKKYRVAGRVRVPAGHCLHVLLVPLVLLSFCPLLPPLQNNSVSQEELECSHLSTAPPPSPPASGSPTSPPFKVATALTLKHIGCFLIPGAPTLDPELWTYSKQFYYEAGKDLART